MKDFQFTEEENRQTFIQWKGTDVCMDWYCDCGEHNHIDKDFAYEVECDKCHAVYAVGTNVMLRKLDLTKEKRYNQCYFPLKERQ